MSYIFFFFLHFCQVTDILVDSMTPLFIHVACVMIRSKSYTQVADELRSAW